MSTTKSPSPQRFHHRHLPTLTRWSTVAFWKWARLHFPILIHARTDTYHKKLHHLVVDIFYAAITFVCIGANLGLAVWFYLYFLPANIEINVSTPKTVTSGKQMALTIAYADPNKPVSDVDIGIYLPEGFLIVDPEQQQGKQEAHFDIGALEHGQAGVVGVVGVVNGSVGDLYDVRVVTSYSYLNHRQYETQIHRFTVDETALHVSVDFPKAIVEDRVISWSVAYDNTADVEYAQVTMQVHAPDGMSTALSGALQPGVSYDSASQTVTVARIAAHTSGSVQMQSIVSDADVQDSAPPNVSDEFELSVSVAGGIVADPARTATLVFSHGTARSTTRVIQPVVTVSVSADEHVDFGETIHATAVLTNTGTDEVTDVRLIGKLSGVPVTAATTTVTIADTDATAAGVDESGFVRFPAVARLAPGEETRFEVRIPTHVVSGERLSSVFTVSGEADVPSLGAVIPIIEQSVQTKYNSRVQLSTEAVYTGPSGEQFGYGPYPPTAGDVTALRIFLKVQNTNNPLSNVRVRAVLPSQVDWTGLYSVSTGTQMTWDESTRTVEWSISSLSPSTSAYGAQFEIRFHPNSLQIGLQPQLIFSQQISGYDTYTAQSVSQTAAPVIIPVAIQP